MKVGGVNISLKVNIEFPGLLFLELKDAIFGIVGGIIVEWVQHVDPPLSPAPFVDIVGYLNVAISTNTHIFSLETRLNNFKLFYELFRQVIPTIKKVKL